MDIRVSGQHVNLSSSQKKYAQEKFSTIGRHDRAAATNIKVSLESNRFTVSANVKIGNTNFFADTTDDESNLYRAIDQTVLKVEKQIRRSKQSKNNHLSVEEKKAFLNELQESEKDAEDEF